MKVIGHQAKAVDDAVIAIAYRCQHTQPGNTFGIVAKDPAAAVAARCDVIQGAGELESERSGHRNKTTLRRSSSAVIDQLSAGAQQN